MTRPQKDAGTGHDTASCRDPPSQSPVIVHATILFVAALLGGIMNAVAGGGSFLTFPTLIVTGVPPIAANATNTVALWPGSIASVGAYRREVRGAPHTLLLSSASLVGGGLGSVLLLHIPSATFARLIPYLLLLTTLLFAFSRPLAARFHKHQGEVREPSWRVLAGLTLAQLAIATYGGFFGAGIGFVMLAVFGLMGLDDMHVMNGLKMLLVSITNGVAVVIFVVARAVVWPQALFMLAGAIAGGYAGAAVGRRLDPRIVRRVVILTGCAMTLYFFARR
jgi:uncharacterized protein